MKSECKILHIWNKIAVLSCHNQSLSYWIFNAFSSSFTHSPFASPLFHSFMIRFRAMQGICAFIISRVLITKMLNIWIRFIIICMQSNGKNRKNVKLIKNFWKLLKGVKAEKKEKTVVCTYEKLETCYLLDVHFSTPRCLKRLKC